MIRALLASGALALGAASPPAAPAPPPITGVAAPTGSPAASFLSLWPACACGRSTVLSQFSLADGRRRRTLARLSNASGGQVADPHAAAGRVWLTFSSGPQCSSPVAGCGPVPDSCSGSTVRYDPVHRAAATALTTPASELVADAVPSPNGRRLALLSADCAHSFLNFHIVVRDLRSGRAWTIGADARACHTLSSVAWSRDGGRLAFPFGPSRLSRRAHYAPGVCPATRSSRLAIVSATRPSPSRAWKLIRADPGCSYTAAAFERRGGLVAIEACGANGLGNAYLVRLDARRHIAGRLPLARGYNDGALATDWRTGTVLVSEYQAANQGTPVYDWVWALRGGRLRLVARYPNRDAPTVIAEPW